MANSTSKSSKGASKSGASKSGAKKSGAAKTGATKSGATKSASKQSGSQKRELISPNDDNRYVKRNAKGQIKESDDQGKSLAKDVQQPAKTKVKPGYGDQGDQPRKPAAAKKASSKKASTKKASTKKST